MKVVEVQEMAHQGMIGMRFQIVAAKALCIVDRKF